MTTINTLDDIINVSDIIERFEELETDLLEAFNEQQEIEETPELTATDYEDALFQEWLKVTVHDDAEEFRELMDLIETLKNEGGDEQWRGDWYPQSLIRESHFEEYMDEMIADCYEIPKLPDFMTVVLDYVALRMDYSDIEIDGVTYLYR